MYKQLTYKIKTRWCKVNNRNMSINEMIMLKQFMCQYLAQCTLYSERTSYIYCTCGMYCDVRLPNIYIYSLRPNVNP